MCRDFVQEPKIARKMLVFFDDNCRSSYVGDTARHSPLDPRRIDFFRYPGDLVDCHLLTKVMETVQEHQRAEWRRRVS